MTDPPIIDPSGNPFALFDKWFEAAKGSEPRDPNAMALATADAAGWPSVRMVLLKEWDERGFVFYTNSESRKGEEIAANARAGLLFYWKSVNRQVRVVGTVNPVSDEESDAYFASRPRQSQIGAWASAQSRPLESRLALEKAVAKYALKFGVGKVARPPHWRGYRVTPREIEFWQDRPFRLHDRVRFTSEGDDWTGTRLYP